MQPSQTKAAARNERERDFANARERNFVKCERERKEEKRIEGVAGGGRLEFSDLRLAEAAKRSCDVFVPAGLRALISAGAKKGRCPFAHKEVLRTKTDRRGQRARLPELMEPER